MKGKHNKIMKTVKCWSRINRGKSHEWVLVEGGDPSNVPLKAWKAFNRAFWQWKTDGLLWPLDELDAYQFAAGQMIAASESEVELTRASRSTYLVAAAFRSLLKYREREVAPAREEYRETCSQARVAAGGDATASRGEDATDREWSDPTARTLDVRSFVESLPGLHSHVRVNAMRLAAVCVHETLTKLDADARRGLHCWLVADGIWTDAAKIHGSSRPWYYALFQKKWAPAFRKACNWEW